MTSLLQGQSQADVPVASNLRAFADGALVVADRIDSYIARGRGWTAFVEGANFSTGLVGGGTGTTIVDTDPELSIDIPTGFTTLPIRFAVQAPPSTVSAADDNEMEILITVDRTAVSGSVAADGTVLVPTNFRTDIVAGCPNDVVQSVVNAAPTTSARSFDLLHETQVADYAGVPANAMWVENSALYEPAIPPLIVGPANISIFFGGTVASEGFIQAVWVTIPTNEIENLVG